MMVEGRSGKLPMKMLIIVLALVLVLGGVGAFVIKGRGGKGEKAKVEEGPKTMVALGEMVVNLADTTQVRYAKVDLAIEVCGEVAGSEGGHGGGGADPTKLRLRDAIIEIISSKRFGQLAAPGGKEELKKQIIAAATERLEGARATEVFFNEFAMQ